MRFRPLSSNSVLPFDAGCTRHGGAAGLTVRRFAALSAPSAEPRGEAGGGPSLGLAYLQNSAAYSSRARIRRVEAPDGGAGGGDPARPACRAAA